MGIAEEVAEDEAPPAWIVKAVHQSVPHFVKRSSFDDYGESDDEDDGYTTFLTLGAPCYGPLQRTAATVDLAFVQYGDDCLSHGGV